MIHTLENMQQTLKKNEKIHIKTTDEWILRFNKHTIISPAGSLIAFDNRELKSYHLINPRHIIRIWISDEVELWNFSKEHHQHLQDYTKNKRKHIR